MRPLSMSFVRISLVITVACVAGLHTPATGAVQQPPAANLPADARLARPITLHAVDVTLAEVLARLSSQGLTLSADSLSGSRKLHIRLTAKPLGTLMRSIAEMLDGNWALRADGHGYLFTESPGAARREDRWWELFLGGRERARQAESAYLLARMSGQPVRHMIFSSEHPTPETESMRAEHQDMTRQSFFYNLSHETQVKIAGALSDYFFYSGTTGGATDEGSIVVPLLSLPETDQKIMLNEYGGAFNPTNTAPDHTFIRFNNYGRVVDVGIIKFDPATLEPHTGDTGLGLGAPICPEACVGLLDQSDLAKVVKQAGGKCPPAWQELAAYQGSRVWNNDAPPKEAWYPPRGWNRADIQEWLADQTGIDFVSDFYNPRGGSHPLLDTERGRALPGEPQARQGLLLGGPDTESEKSHAAALKAELDLLARDHDLSWQRNAEDVYLFRNNRWYRDDRLEVPSDQLRAWMERMFTLPVLFKEGQDPNERFADPAYIKPWLDWELNIASKLTEWQIGNGLAWAAMLVPVDSPEMQRTFGFQGTTPSFSFRITSSNDKMWNVPGRPPLPRTAYTVYPFYSAAMYVLGQPLTLRFYASLTEAQRIALAADQLPFSELTLAQQQAAFEAAPTLPYLASHGPFLLGVRMRAHAAIMQADAPTTFRAPSFCLAPFPIR